MYCKDLTLKPGNYTLCYCPNEAKFTSYSAESSVNGDSWSACDCMDMDL